MTDSHDPSPIHTRTSPRIVIACLAAMAVFIGAVALLYWTWLPRQNPNTMIIVQGDAGYVGAEVTVDPAAPNTTPLTAILAAEDNYRVRIHVPPGVYRVTIRHGGRVIASSDAEPAAREPAYMRLTPSDKSPTTRRSR